MPRKKVDVNDVKEKVNKKASESLKDTMLKEESKKTSAKTVVKKAAEKKNVTKTAAKGKGTTAASKGVASTGATKTAAKGTSARSAANKSAPKGATKAAEKGKGAATASKGAASTGATKTAKKGRATTAASKKAATTAKKATTKAKKTATKSATKKKTSKTKEEVKVSPYANDPYAKTKGNVGRSLGWGYTEVKETEKHIIDEPIAEELAEDNSNIVEFRVAKPDGEVIDEQVNVENGQQQEAEIIDFPGVENKEEASEPEVTPKKIINLQEKLKAVRTLENKAIEKVEQNREAEIVNYPFNSKENKEKDDLEQAM